MSHNRKPSFKEQMESGLRRMQSLSRNSKAAQDEKPPSRERSLQKEKLSRQGSQRRPEKEVQEDLERQKDQAVAALPDGYFQEVFEAPLFELQKMPPNFQASDLDAVTEERANILEHVSERLSKHVLANYDVFVKGINEAASVDSDLQSALLLVKGTRARLANTLAEVRANVTIAEQQHQRQRLEQLADILVKLRQASLLHTELKDAQENGEFADCFWLCAQCCRSLESLQTLRVTSELLSTIDRLYAETIQRLAAALQSICSDFNGMQYCKILEGYSFLGNTADLGEEVTASFASVINSGALKVVRGVVLTRAGLEDKARSTTMLQEIVKWLPPDLFRQCLAKVLMVIFDILASHHRMLRWHEQRIQDHLQDLSQLRQSQQEETASAKPSVAVEQLERDHAASNEREGPSSSEKIESMNEESTAAENYQLESRDRGTEWRESPAAQQNGYAPESRDGSDVIADRTTLRSFGSSVRLQGNDSGAEFEGSLRSQGGASTSQRLESETAWGEALMRVAEGLEQGRRWLWDEAARKLATLLAAPAAFHGEHFLQVLEWTQMMLQIGEAFSGNESSSLRDAMQRHSGKFFQAFHTTNLQALQAMLEQELWKRLPMPSGRQPNFLSALEGGSAHAAEQRFNANSFPEWVAHGNPWKRQLPGSATELGSGSATEEGTSSEDEAEELYGDSIDEDSQRVRRSTDPAHSPSTSSRGEGDVAMTNASWRMLQWMGDYADLMRMLRADSGKIYSSCCELFELYFLHVFHIFSDVPLSDIANARQSRQGGADSVPSRLRNAILRILHKSLPKMKALYLPPELMTSPGQSELRNKISMPMHFKINKGISVPQDIGYKLGVSRGSPNQAGSPAQTQPSTANGHTPPAITALSNPGNMYGLQERKIAVDSLLAVGEQIQAAQTALSERLVGRSDIPDHHSLDTFFQTVKAAADLRDVVLRAAARLNMPIGWIPDRLSEQNFNLEEPPTKASPWVGVLLNHLRVFWQRLETASSMSPEDLNQLWRFGLAFAAEVVLEGLARAGVKGRCTVMGRSAMSLDLQGLQHGLQGIAGGPQTAEATGKTLRIVDAYIKAFYIPWGPELHRWALTHQEYTTDQIMMLVNCIAEANNLKRRDRNALMTRIEADLRAMR